MVEHDQWRVAYQALMEPLYLPALCLELSSPCIPSKEEGVGFDPASLRIENQPAWRQAIDLVPADPVKLRDLAGEVRKQGRWGEALALLQEAVVWWPGCSEVAHAMAEVIRMIGHASEAERWYRLALELEPERANTRLALAEILIEQKSIEEARGLIMPLSLDGPLQFELLKALAALQFATVHNGNEEVAIHGLLEAAGSDREHFRQVVDLLRRSGRAEQAIELLQEAVLPPLEPWSWDLEKMRCLILGGMHSEALNAGLQLVKEHPEVGQLWLETGIVQIGIKNYEGAESSFRAAIERVSCSASAWHHLGLAVEHQGRIIDAHCYYLEALKIDAFNSMTHSRLGRLKFLSGNYESALQTLTTALFANPRNPLAWSTLGPALYQMGDFENATVLCTSALEIDDSHSFAHFNLSLTLLGQGRYREAWPHYERRLGELVKYTASPSFRFWDGESVIEELILLAEQGIGDLVQFMRYSVILRLGIPKVSILAPRKLQTLLLHYGAFDSVYVQEGTLELGDGCAGLPLMSVPRLLELTPEAVLIDEPYLSPETESAGRWRRRIRAAGDHLVVGLNWQGNPATEVGDLVGRSFLLEALAPLAELANVEFVSLQKGPGSEQLQACSFRHRFVACQPEIDATWDFVETLSILSACDLVITSDTSVAHLAGALGLPTWLLLKRVPEWRWGLEGETTPWYRTMRLFRQKHSGDWAELIGRVKQELSQVVVQQEGKRLSPSVSAPEQAGRENGGWRELYEDQMRRLYLPALWSELPAHGASPREEGFDFDPASMRIANQPEWRQALQLLPADPVQLQELAAEVKGQGRWGEALALLREGEMRWPGTPEVAQAIGETYNTIGDGVEAERWYRRALELRPERLETRLALGELLIGAGRLEEAGRLVQSLTLEGPQRFEVLLTRFSLHLAGETEGGLEEEIGVLLEEAGKDPERFRRVVALLRHRGRQEQAVTLLRSGSVPPLKPWEWEVEILRTMKEDGKGDEALEEGRKLAAAYPEEGEIWLELGMLQEGLEHYEEAETAFRTATERMPMSAQAWLNLGSALARYGKITHAANYYLHSLKLAPFSSAVHINLGITSFGLADLALVARLTRSALLLHPRNGLAWTTLAMAAHQHGDHFHAENLVRNALALDSKDSNARFNLSLFLLAQGRYQEAWPHYDCRLEQRVRFKAPLSFQPWDGESAIEELILLAEQGIGDLVQFMRYSVILRLGIPKVSILAPRKLQTLLLHYGAFDSVYVQEEPLELGDACAGLPLLSVPWLLKLTPDAVLLDEPYMIPEQESAGRWRSRIKTASDRLVVGLNWQGNPAAEVGEMAGRSLPLEALAPLAELANVEFVSLQKGPGSEQLQACSFRHRFVACQPEIDATWDFVETLSILSACDLVITSDTIVAHLAGALGLPTWVLLKRVPEWRWGLEGETTPWYRTMRLFRQRRDGDWTELMGRVKQELANHF